MASDTRPLPPGEGYCAYADCPSPKFIGAERDVYSDGNGAGHVHVPGNGRWHFRCYLKARREMVGQERTASNIERILNYANGGQTR